MKKQKNNNLGVVTLGVLTFLLVGVIVGVSLFFALKKPVEPKPEPKPETATALKLEHLTAGLNVKYDGVTPDNEEANNDNQEQEQNQEKKTDFLKEAKEFAAKNWIYITLGFVGIVVLGSVVGVASRRK